MTGVEIDMIVSNSLEALKLYEDIFKVERIEVTDFETGQNEAIFSIYSGCFHLLDENPQYGLIAPRPGDNKSMWVNVMVPDIEATYTKAINAGCSAIQPVTNLPDFGVSNAMFSDPFGYIWMIHQVHKDVCYEDRMELMKKNMSNDLKNDK